MNITDPPEIAGPGEDPVLRTDGPVHLWFGLSYCNFSVWHRAHLQSMPLSWQQRFVDLADELNAAYPDGTGVDYQVDTVRSEYVSELTSAEMRQLGVSTSDEDEEPGPRGLAGLARRCLRRVRRLDPPEGQDEDSWREREYYLNGRAVPDVYRVGIPVPDPVPHYNRGRTYLPPDEEGIAACREARAQRRHDWW